ncbi:MAG: hypothetical protein O9284_15035 [Steroidobacteraceae bacterium]|nr:hypothetical protein [Steroidobacteraceae bacterium]
MPTPGGPSSSSASPFATQRPVASSRICLGVDRGLGVEVERVERAHARELGDRRAHLDAARVLAGDLGLAQEEDRVEQRQLPARRVFEQVGELVADRGQLEPRQHAHERVVGDHGAPPPASV